MKDGRVWGAWGPGSTPSVGLWQRHSGSCKLLAAGDEMGEEG